MIVKAAIAFVLLLAVVAYGEDVTAGSCPGEGSQLVAGKVIIVTGATSGIGKATAIELAKEGAKVVVSGRRETKGLAVVEEIRANGGDALFVKCDVTEEADVKNLVDQTLATYGRLDGAFNNAGASVFMPVTEVTTEHYYKMHNINTKGVMLCTKYEVEAMKRNGAAGGSIVNHASIATRRAFPGGSQYTSSKAAVWQFSNVVAAEMGALNIRINTLNTGVVPDTDIWDNNMSTEEREMIVNSIIPSIPMGRVGETWEIAQPVIFLLSDRASYITGVDMVVDGGHTL